MCKAALKADDFLRQRGALVCFFFFFFVVGFFFALGGFWVFFFLFFLDFEYASTGPPSRSSASMMTSITSRLHEDRRCPLKNG